MTNNKIIYKAVLKAKANGYKNSDLVYFLDNNLWEMFIFDIDFAKAFFGVEKRLCKVCDGLHSVTNPLTDEKYTCVCNKDGYIIKEIWKDHLCQMVILEENERIKYLEKFL